LELGTWQGDPLGGALFVLIHFHVFHLIIATQLTFVFLSLRDDTHIVGPTLDVVPTLLWLQEKLLTLGLSMQLAKCVVCSF
jgi:hypothetical protein